MAQHPEKKPSLPERARQKQLKDNRTAAKALKQLKDKLPYQDKAKGLPANPRKPWLG